MWWAYLVPLFGIGLNDLPETGGWGAIVPHLISKRSVGPEYEKQILISSCTHSCNSNPSPSAFYGEKSSSVV